MGFGFVQFKTKEAVNKALKTLQMSELDGKSLELKRSERTLKYIAFLIVHNFFIYIIILGKNTNLTEKCKSKPNKLEPKFLLRIYLSKRVKRKLENSLGKEAKTKNIPYFFFIFQYIWRVKSCKDAQKNDRRPYTTSGLCVYWFCNRKQRKGKTNFLIITFGYWSVYFRVLSKLSVKVLICMDVVWYWNGLKSRKTSVRFEKEQQIILQETKRLKRKRKVLWN